VPAEFERRVSELERSSEVSINIPEWISALERFCVALSQSAVMNRNWNHDLNARIDEMEKRADDLELIRLFEIRDERDDRVSALEGAAAAYEEWRPWVEASIYDVRFDFHRALNS
jgi:hypothetical protein